MRVAVAALVVCAGVPVFCQSSGTAPPSFGNEKKDAPTVFLSQKELSKGPPVGQITFGQPLKMVFPLGAESLQQLGRPSVTPPVDPRMIVHPPASSIGVQPPGTQIAQNLYPGLQLMPIDQSKAKAAPIPITFPNMKFEKIPTTWPQYKMSPIQSGKAEPAKK